MLIKLMLVVSGCAFFLFLLGQTVVRIVSPKREEAQEYVPLAEAGNLVWLLADTAAGEQTGQEGEMPEETGASEDLDGAAEGMKKPDPDAVLALLQRLGASADEGWLTCAQAQQLTALLPACGSLEGMDSAKSSDKVEASVWYAWFDAARELYDPMGKIRDIPVTILGVGGQVKKNDGSILNSQMLVTTQEEWRYYAPRFAEGGTLGRCVVAVARSDGLYAIRRIEPESSFTLSNVWVTEASAEGIRCFFNDYELEFLPPDDKEDQEGICIEGGLDAGEEKKDVVADLFFSEGRITAVAYKENKLSGRLLRLADGGAEIEGEGFFPFSDELRVYRLYGRMKSLSGSDLRIGYAFTDFVVADGVIEAALVSREERMENIRVLIKTSDYGSAYHDSVEILADCGCTVISGKYDEPAEMKLEAGKTLLVSQESSLFAEGDRIWIRPEILTGHISLLNVARSQAAPSYRGSFELIRTQDGIVVINEVLLEEYLYAVVPSEMPAGYPIEALKSQAICARTYAYAKMCRAGLPSYGAHVDDSAGFQVYQNMEENAETTRAVKETKGQVLCYGQELAETFYYSTSCGYGTDAGIWMSSDAESYPYLVAQQIGEGDHFFEEEEPWFRWQYKVETLDADILNETVIKRYQASPQSVLTKQQDGSFVSQKPPSLGKIKDICVVRYNAGGSALELEITGENATVLIRTEHNIRYVLCDQKTQVVRQDGSLVSAQSMVPSGFFSIETFKEDGFVIGYTLSGGGFGHGVGMSQNGAKNMALSGFASDDILGFFFRGCTLSNIYMD